MFGRWFKQAPQSGADKALDLMRADHAARVVERQATLRRVTEAMAEACRRLEERRG